MTTEQEFIDSIDGELTHEQVGQLLGLTSEGDTGGQPDDGGQPEAAPAKGDNEPQGGKEGETGSAPEVDSSDVDLDPANTVILAKDGKHTISYDKLVAAREAEKQAKAEAQEARAALEAMEALLAKAQARADAGAEPTETDNQVAAAEAAIAAGVDPGLFGDFSEEALAQGIQKLVDSKVAAIVAEIEAKLEPLQVQQTLSAAEEHYKAIYDAHPDADSIAESQELADWIQSQPAFVRSGYESVLTDGSTTDVIELFSAFKAATGQTPDPATESDAVKAQAKAVIAQAAAPVPHSLSDLPGGRAGAVTREDAMAEMDGVQLLDAMHDMAPEQIERYLNSL